LRQAVHFLKARDGASLAWAVTGRGTALLKASNWLTHAEYDWDSPVWRHWIEFFSAHFRFVRYDERGCGMSDWDVADTSAARWLDDLEDVVAVAAPAAVPPPILLGVSQGAATAVAYAVRHPEKVSRLILYGGYALGWRHRGDEAGRKRFEAIIALARYGWGTDNPAFRQVFTQRFIPEGSERQLAWFNELCRKTVHPEMAARLLEARADVDVVDLLPRVGVPTLVLHAREDEVVPLLYGRQLAARIPGARFVQLESRNHILLEGEPAWQRFQDEVLDFTREARPPGEDPIFLSLSRREREILRLAMRGHDNAHIGAALFIGDKTVRNHVSRIYEKLGVASRAQAIALAHERGFAAGD
jgi:pimeloyl-ACP methyl ester carboxylesterase/DNA-binding CsgD family transcriptional regulator